MIRQFSIGLFFILFVTSLPIKAQKIAATLDFGNFRANDTMGLFEYYISFPANSLTHQKNAKGKLESVVSMKVQVKKAGNIVFLDNFKVNSQATGDVVSEEEEYQVQNRIILPKGSYTFRIEAQDELSKVESQLQVEVPIDVGYDNELIQVSDIQNLKSYSPTKETGSNVKNGIKMIARNSNFFGGKDAQYIFYAEVYNANNVMAENAEYLVEIRVEERETRRLIPQAGIFKKLKADNVSPLLAEINLNQVPSGNFFLVIEVKNKANESLYTKEKFFQRFNPDLPLAAKSLDDEETENPDLSQQQKCGFEDEIDKRNLSFYLNGLLPLARQSEKDFAEAVINSGDEQQQFNYLCYFFQKRETSELSAKALFYDYKERLETAEKKYSTQTMPGYQTDRGRILIQYGKPNRIDDEFTNMSRSSTDNSVIPHEIWTYFYVTEPQQQSNVQFIFAQKNRANNNYQLIHSTAIGEFRNDNWQEEVRGNMMFNEDLGNYR